MVMERVRVYIVYASDVRLLSCQASRSNSLIFSGNRAQLLQYKRQHFHEHKLTHNRTIAN